MGKGSKAGKPVGNSPCGRKSGNPPQSPDTTTNEDHVKNNADSLHEVPSDVGLYSPNSEALRSRPAMDLSSHQFRTGNAIPDVGDMEWYQKKTVCSFSQKFGPPQTQEMSLVKPKESEKFISSLPGNPDKSHWMKQMLMFWEEESKAKESRHNSTMANFSIGELVAMDLSPHQFRNGKATPKAGDMEWYEKKTDCNFSQKLGPPRTNSMSLVKPKENKDFVSALPGDPGKSQWKKQVLKCWQEDENALKVAAGYNDRASPVALDLSAHQYVHRTVGNKVPPPSRVIKDMEWYYRVQECTFPHRLRKACGPPQKPSMSLVVNPR